MKNAIVERLKMSCNHNYKHINLRRGPYAQMRRENPLLQEGEVAHAYAESHGFYIVKIGDGVTLWNDLPCLVFSLANPPTTTPGPCVEAEYVVFDGGLEDTSFFAFDTTVEEVFLTEENDPSLPSPSGYEITFTDKPETSPQMSVNYSDKRSRLSYDNYEATVNIYLETTTGRQTQFGETIPIFGLGYKDLELHHVLPSGSLSYSILKTASNDDGSISGTILIYQSDDIYESGDTSINIPPSAWFNTNVKRINKAHKVTMSGVTVLDWSEALSGVDIGVNQTTHSIVMGNALPSGHVQRIQCPESMFVQISEIGIETRGEIPSILDSPAGGNIYWDTKLPKWSGEYDWLEDYPEFPRSTYADDPKFQNTVYDYIVRSPEVVMYKDLAPNWLHNPEWYRNTEDTPYTFLNTTEPPRNINSIDSILVGSGTKLEVLNRFDQVVFTLNGPIGLWNDNPDHPSFPNNSGAVYAEWIGSDPVDNIPWEEKIPSGVRHFIKALTTEEINERFGVDPSIAEVCEGGVIDFAVCEEALTKSMVYRFKGPTPIAGNNSASIESNQESTYRIKVTDTTSSEVTELCDEGGNPPTSGLIMDTFKFTRLCEVVTTPPPEFLCVIDKPTTTTPSPLP